MNNQPEKPEKKDRRIPEDKDDIKVTPFGTKKKKRDVPDQDPREEFVEQKPNQKSDEKETDKS